MLTVLELLAEGRATLVDSRRAIDTAERLERPSRDLALTYRRGALRLSRGSSDVNEQTRPNAAPPAPEKPALLTKLLLEERPLCVACISAKSGVLAADIEPVVARLEQTIFVKRDMAQCRICERWTLVYSLSGKSPRR